VNWRLRYMILRRDNFRCVACGRSPATHPGTNLQIDHIIPWRAGGETEEKNLQTLCEMCNGGKSDLLPTKNGL
jgi:5-methylcytosine-specific restriction endonuclease McrA